MTKFQNETNTTNKLLLDDYLSIVVRTLFNKVIEVFTTVYYFSNKGLFKSINRNFV